MPYSIVADSLGRFAVEFKEEPEFIRGFGTASDRLEPELMVGRWLHLGFAIWNSADRRAVRDAVVVAKRFGGRFRLAVRPFEEYVELTRILPAPSDARILDVATQIAPEGELSIKIRAAVPTPYWHWMIDGAVVERFIGPMDVERLAAFAASCLSRAPGA